jgi:DNA repair protein RecO (recombination protein O)|tara:strand:+ start:3722 stop:4411 length:690 start_codon:yes stop_codon:yes gene_type:complete
MPAAQMEPALILHVRPYRETSAIVQMFTQGQGRLAGVLRGYRSKKQGQRNIQPFSVGTVSWVGRSELVTIQKFESHHFVALQGEALYAGFYVLELLTRLLRERQQEPQLFHAAMQVLEALEEGDALQPALRLFELELLDQLGYGIDFSTAGEPLQANAFYRFEPQVGFHRVSADEESARALSGRLLQAIASRDFNDTATLDAAKALMRAAIEPLLGDKPLTSRKMFQRH